MSKKDDFKKQIYGNPNWIDGRINRLEYFWRTLLTGIVFELSTGGAVFLYLADNKLFACLVALFAAFCLWRLTMAYVKRLHDLGWNGWLALFILGYGLEEKLINNEALSIAISLFSFVLSLFLLFRKGDKGVNKYGKDPLMKYEENQ